MGTKAVQGEQTKAPEAAPALTQAGLCAPGWWSGIRGRLGLERNILVMLGIILLVGLGEELWVRFLPQYLVVLGAGTWGVAAYGALKDLLDAVYQYPGGWLADHLGRRRALMLFTLVAAVGYGVYLLAPSWEWILLGTVLVMAWDSLTLPALFAVVADTLPQNRRATGFGMQSLLRRVPTIVAPPVGGALVLGLGFAAGMQVGLALTVGLALLAVWLVARFYHELRPQPGPPVPAIRLWRETDPRLKRLLLADCLARWAEGIPRVFVPLYVLDVLGLSPLAFGWLIVLQRVTNVAVYVPLAPMSDRMNRKPFVLTTFAFFALFPLVLVMANGLAGAALAFVVAGLWEIGEPARKALIVDLAHESVRGRAIGLYYLLRNLSVFPTALVGGLIWSTLGPQYVFYSAFGVGVLGFLVYALWGAGDDAGERIRTVAASPANGGAVEEGASGTPPASADERIRGWPPGEEA
jgi:MFS family permease